ncbi:hypothetical protein J6590_070999 [Homalodisca vitripennis]|nr:hypothetical protein J6590_070999 [Homalodisca vitripennis]
MASHQSGLLTRTVPHRCVLPHVTQLASPTDGITSIRVANSDCSTSLCPATLFHIWVLPHVTQLATPTDGITSIRVANSDCSTSGSCHTSPNSPHRLMASHQSGLLTRTVPHRWVLPHVTQLPQTVASHQSGLLTRTVPHRWVLPHVTQLATPTDGITSIRVANSDCSTSLGPATRHPTRHTD